MNLRSIITLVALALVVKSTLAAEPSTQDATASIQWQSAATGTAISGEVLRPTDHLPVETAPRPTVLYLKNLSIARLGQEPDESILRDLRTDGYLVLVLDYKKNLHAVSPDLNADMLKLRQDIGGKKKTLLTDFKIDPNHVFILLEGFRLKRDVEFARNHARILAMDVQYPSHPLHPVPALLEFTCDNVNRMGISSLLFCHDTLLDGGMAAGFAVAMADHPVAPPYKGIDDPMPDCIYRSKAAVRTLRSLTDELDLNGKIGAIGFSRGGPMAALLAVTPDRPNLEGPGPHSEISSTIQAALIHGNRYDYLKMATDDPMYKRFEKAWGPRETNADHWAEHGAAFYLKKSAAPMFLNTSATESKEYQFGLATFDAELTAAGIDHVYQVDPDTRGHQVTTNPQTLSKIYNFFTKSISN